MSTNMASTRSFNAPPVGSEAAFREALLREGIATMLAGDFDTGKAILCDYIKATIGFEKLGEATGTQPKSLIRMFGPRGNPQARNLFSVLGYLQKQAWPAAARYSRARIACRADLWLIDKSK